MRQEAGISPVKTQEESAYGALTSTNKLICLFQICIVIFCCQVSSGGEFLRLFLQVCLPASCRIHADQQSGVTSCRIHVD